MQESKSCALPLGDTPITRGSISQTAQAVNCFFGRDLIFAPACRTILYASRVLDNIGEMDQRQFPFIAAAYQMLGAYCIGSDVVI